MCRRDIEPRKGFWTLPAGFMEQLETTQQGAAREAKEEACADVDIGPLLAIYNVERISQVQIFYRGDLRSPDIGSSSHASPFGSYPCVASGCTADVTHATTDPRSS